MRLDMIHLHILVIKWYSTVGTMATKLFIYLLSNSFRNRFMSPFPFSGFLFPLSGLRIFPVSGKFFIGHFVISIPHHLMCYNINKGGDYNAQN